MNLTYQWRMTGVKGRIYHKLYVGVVCVGQVYYDSMASQGIPAKYRAQSFLPHWSNGKVISWERFEGEEYAKDRLLDYAVCWFNKAQEVNE